MGRIVDRFGRPYRTVAEEKAEAQNEQFLKKMMEQQSGKVFEKPAILKPRPVIFGPHGLPINLGSHNPNMKRVIFRRFKGVKS